jgi:hypothetical protein
MHYTLQSCQYVMHTYVCKWVKEQVKLPVSECDETVGVVRFSVALESILWKRFGQNLEIKNPVGQI